MKLKTLSFSVLLSMFAYNSVNAQDSIVKAAILDDGSQNAEKSYNQGIQHFASKNFKEALTDFNAAISIKPDFDKAYFNRGNTKMELNDLQGALADFNMALNISQQSDYFFGRAQVKYATSDKSGAEQDYSKAIELNTGYSQAF